MAGKPPRLPPSMRGVKKRLGREYIWLLNSDGKPEKHYLDNYRDTKKTKDDK